MTDHIFKYYLHLKPDYQFLLKTDDSELVSETMKEHGDNLVVETYGVASIKMSLEFDDAMAKVSTIADESKVPLEELEDQIISLAKELGKPATEIAENVYKAISAGQETGDAMKTAGRR